MSYRCRGKVRSTNTALFNCHIKRGVSGGQQQPKSTTLTWEFSSLAGPQLLTCCLHRDRNVISKLPQIPGDLALSH